MRVLEGGVPTAKGRVQVTGGGVVMYGGKVLNGGSSMGPGLFLFSR